TIDSFSINTPDTMLICGDTGKAELWVSSNVSEISILWSNTLSFSDTLKYVDKKNNDTTFDITIDQDSTIYVKVEDSFGCSIIDTIFLKHSFFKAGMLSYKDTGCAPLTVDFRNGSINAVNEYWDFGDFGDTTSETNPTITFDSSGFHEFCAIAESRCNTKDTLCDTVWVYGNTDSLQLPKDTVTCDTTILDVEANSFGSATSFHWSSFSDMSDTLNNYPSDSVITINTATSEEFYYMVASNPSCSKKDSIFVDNFSSQVELDASSFLCQGDTTNIKATNLLPSQKLNYNWEPDSMIISGDSTLEITVSPDQTTSYKLSATNKKGC
ncbi:MAG: hypothetical protein ABEH43_07580, partial [Flavobacteriales bacterium]